MGGERGGGGGRGGLFEGEGMQGEGGNDGVGKGV